MKIGGTLAVALALLMAAPTSAQLECEIFGCPDAGGDETSGGDDTSSGDETSGGDENSGGDETSGGDTPTEGEETPDGDESGGGPLALPDPASDRAVESSAKGIETANSKLVEVAVHGGGLSEQRAARGKARAGT